MQSVWRLEFGVKKKKIASNSANYKVRAKYVSVLHVPRKNKKDGWMDGRKKGSKRKERISTCD